MITLWQNLSENVHKCLLAKEKQWPIGSHGRSFGGFYQPFRMPMKPNYAKEIKEELLNVADGLKVVPD